MGRNQVVPLNHILTKFRVIGKRWKQATNYSGEDLNNIRNNSRRNNKQHLNEIIKAL